MGSSENTKLCDFTSHNNSDFVAPPAPSTKFFVKLAYSCGQFSKEGEDAISHLGEFEDLCDNNGPEGVDIDMFKLEYFPFTLRGKAKNWFLALPNEHKDSWINCKAAFMLKFYHPKIDFENCNVMEVISFLEKTSQDPNFSELNMSFIKFSTNTLIKVGKKSLD